MKYIRIFGFVWLIGLLALPLDALACDNFKAKVDAAQQAIDDAEKKRENFDKEELP